MKPWPKFGSVVAALVFLAACSNGVQIPEVESTLESQADGQFYGRIGASSDDAEQYQSGSVSVSSSDLDLGSSSSGATTVGLRYTDITIPAGATITEAYITFIPKGSRSTAATFTFRGQGTSDTGTFSAVTNDLSRRPLTSASVMWNAPAWTASTTFPGDGSGRSANLKNIAQEVVDRSGWTSGNAMTFFITGTGKRLAYSFESTGKSPALFVKYTTDTNPPPPPEGNRFKADFAMTVKPDFSVAQLEAYDAQQGTEAAKWYKRLVASSEFSKSYESDFENQGQGYLRTMSRTMGPDVSELLLAFRATGSRVILDRVHELMDVSLSYLQNKDGYLLWEYKNASDWHGSGLEDGLAHGMVAQATYAFYLNRDVDPKYAQMYNRLKDYLRNNWEASLTNGNGYDGGATLNDNWLLHSYIGFLRYYWYMHLTLKDSPNSAEAQDADKYLVEAQRKSQVVSQVLQTAPNNTFVYSHFVWPDAKSRTQLSNLCNVQGSNFSCGYHPLGYPREGAYSWNALILDDLPTFDKAFAQKLARSYRLNIFNGKPFDGGRNDQVFSRDVGYDTSNPCTDLCEGKSLTFSGTHPFDNEQVSITYTGNGKENKDGTENFNGYAFFANEDGMAYLGLWDTSGETIDETLAIYTGLETEEQPKSYAVPALMTAYELYLEGQY